MFQFLITRVSGLNARRVSSQEQNRILKSFGGYQEGVMRSTNLEFTGADYKRGVEVSINQSNEI